MIGLSANPQHWCENNARVVLFLIDTDVRAHYLSNSQIFILILIDYFQYFNLIEFFTLGFYWLVKIISSQTFKKKKLTDMFYFFLCGNCLDTNLILFSENEKFRLIVLCYHRCSFHGEHWKNSKRKRVGKSTLDGELPVDHCSC